MHPARPACWRNSPPVAIAALGDIASKANTAIINSIAVTLSSPR
jgi:hypothetical protein